MMTAQHGAGVLQNFALGLGKPRGAYDIRRQLLYLHKLAHHAEA